jgi:hypothetical protein
MRIIGEISDLTTSQDFNGYPVEHGEIYEGVSCPKCSGVMFRSGNWYDQMDPEDWRGTIFYPEVEKEIDGLPPEISNEYLAAQRVASLSANAYAVLLGRVLDLVCENRGATGDTLYKRLKDLADKGEIPGTLAEIAHKLRYLRNVGAHANLGTLTKDEVPVLAALCRAVLEYVYSAPRLVARVEGLVEKLKNP